MFQQQHVSFPKYICPFLRDCNPLHLLSPSLPSPRQKGECEWAESKNIVMSHYVMKWEGQGTCYVGDLRFDFFSSLFSLTSRHLQPTVS